MAIRATKEFIDLWSRREALFNTKGLTHDQEDMLSSIIRRHSDEVLRALDSGQEFELRLGDVIRRLSGQAAAAGAPPRTAAPAPT